PGSTAARRAAAAAETRACRAAWPRSTCPPGAACPALPRAGDQAVGLQSLLLHVRGSDHRPAGQGLLAVASIPLLLHLVQDPHRRQYRPTGHVRLPAILDGIDELRGDELGVFLLSGNRPFAFAGRQGRSTFVGAVA